MNGFTDNEMPHIAILLAVHEPRLDWLRELLVSLNAQSYPNLSLYIIDDCSKIVTYEEILSCVQEHVTAFPYYIEHNDINLGSNRTFELLTEKAKADYFAFCDQDDIWLPEKLSVLQKTIEDEKALLVCSDMFIIDKNGKQTASSITKVRKRHVFHSGDNLAEGLIFHNFVSGCTMLVRAGEAKSAIPFCPYMVHDNYLALWCATRGKLVSVSRQLIYYRIHEGNQTKILKNVVDKESYRKLRIDIALQKILWLQNNLNRIQIDSKLLNDGLLWVKARHDRFIGNGKTAHAILKYCGFSPLTSLFELVSVYFPDKLFAAVLRLINKGFI